MPKKELTFEKAMDRLEEIVSLLESGDSPLDESLSLFEEGVKLVKLCNSQLEKAESSVKMLINQDGELVEKNLGLVPTRTEGVRDGRWAVIDYGDVIVHIFNDETRLFYHLERLWKDGENFARFDEKAGDLVTAD